MKRENGFLTGFMYVLLVFLVVGLAILVLFNYQANAAKAAEREAAEQAALVTPTPEPTATPAPTAIPQRNTETITLAFAGDIVGQAGLSTDAESVDGDVTSYDYTNELIGVADSLADCDFAACTLVGTLKDNGPFEDGYHMSSELTAALAGAGFHAVNTATDHILDEGLEGLIDTVNALDQGQIMNIGTCADASAHDIFMTEVRNVKVAVLSYTYGTGGVSVIDNDWCVDVLTTDYITTQETVDYERIDADIKAARDNGADIVVCFVYWWDNTQYYTTPRDSEREVVAHLFENGVDVVIGGGVKTPQPIETQTVTRTDGTAANCVACYSLSNLMSCFNDVYTNLSATARITVSRDVDTGEIWISEVCYEPLFMLDTDDYPDYEDPGFRYRLLDARAALRDFDDGGTTISEETAKAIREGISSLQSILGEQYDSFNGGMPLAFPY